VEAISADTLTNNRGWRVEARLLSYECIVRDFSESVKIFEDYEAKAVHRSMCLR